MTFVVSAWAKDYVGIPFLAMGRTMAGLDCWSLLQLVYRERFAIEVPDYPINAADLKSVARAVATGKHGAAWRAVERGEAIDGDAVLMAGHFGDRNRIRRSETHVGIFVAPGHVLHVEEATSSTVVRLSNPSVAFRIASFHRHVARD